MTKVEYHAACTVATSKLGLTPYEWTDNEEAILALVPLEALEYILNNKTPGSENEVWDTGWVEKANLEYTNRMLLL